MKPKITKTFYMAVACAAVAAAGLAFAHQATERDGDPGGDEAAADIAKAGISLVQAVGIAESSQPGRAARAELESRRSGLAYEIEIVAADQRVFDVRVDAVSGKVLSSTQDQPDRGGGDEKDDKD